MKKSFYIQKTLQLASQAMSHSEVPIGALIVKDGKIIAKAFNSTERRMNFTAHAEMIAIEKACRKLKTKYLTGCDLFVSLEPCSMCRTAARLSRMRAVYYLMKSPKFGARGKALFKTKFIKQKRSTQNSHQLETAENLMRDFFQKKRSSMKKPEALPR